MQVPVDSVTPKTVYVLKSQAQGQSSNIIQRKVVDPQPKTVYLVRAQNDSGGKLVQLGSNASTPETTNCVYIVQSPSGAQSSVTAPVTNEPTKTVYIMPSQQSSPVQTTSSVPANVCYVMVQRTQS